MHYDYACQACAIRRCLAVAKYWSIDFACVCGEQVHREPIQHTPDLDAWDSHMTPLENSLQPAPVEVAAAAGNSPIGV